MRSLTDSRRRRRPDIRERSRFGRGGKGNRDLMRFRRNRELLAREVTTLILWIAVAVMLLNLASTLRDVAGTHLAQRSALLRNSLPLLPLLAAVLCVWRARLNFTEIREIRAEQAEVKRRLAQADDPDEDDTPERS